MKKPDLYHYLNHREYLRDWFEWRRSEDPKFSKRAFARLAGKSSPGLLAEVIEGKRTLTEKNCAAFAQALGLSAAQRDFFTALVRLDQARTPKERNDAWAVVAASKAFREARPIEGKSVGYLSKWYYPAIRELAAVPGFQNDPEWVAHTIRPQITVAQARRALEVIADLELIERTESGEWTTTDGIITTPHEVQGLVAHNYHFGMLALAGEAIERFQPEQRHFLAATIAIPSRSMPKLKRELDALQERILEMAASESEDADEVVQVNLHIFPLTAVQSKEMM